MKRILILLILAVILQTDVSGQIRIKGQVTDQKTARPLRYVSIGIENRNIGTVADHDGHFDLLIPVTHNKDTLTFSLIGYTEYKLALKDLQADSSVTVQLHQNTAILEQVVILGKSLKKQQFGIKHRGLLIHFSDGIFNPDDSFEIGQLIHLGAHPIRITELNLFLLASKRDSATFRINFYRYLNGKPGKQLLKKGIIQRHVLQKGWLKFNLTNENIYLCGDVIAALEFLPETTESQNPINFEVKLGGTSKSFYRHGSLGAWNTPPHHYCLNVSALASANAPDPLDEDIQAAPAFVYHSDAVGDDFHIYLDLPKAYDSNSDKRYPVLYLLDANAYFDHVKDAVKAFQDKYPQSTPPIIVGIGYQNAYLMDSLRVRDDTYPKALPVDSFPTSGGADQFYSFITEELISHIDSCYRTDTASRTLMGHSFGGYFVLYALLRHWNSEQDQQGAFNNYISASPSINYHHDYIVGKLEQTIKQGHSSIHTKKQLYLTIGERELDPHTKSLFRKLTKALNTQTKIRITTKVFPNTEHLGTAVPTFKTAIPILYQ